MTLRSYTVVLLATESLSAFTDFACSLGVFVNFLFVYW